MSLSGGSERIGFLRAAIARIEAQNPAGALASSAARGRVCEIVPATYGDGTAACGFALSLAIAAAARPGLILWVVEDFACHEAGSPYGPGLHHHGLPLERFVLVRVAGPQQALWALEEALKSRACAAAVGELRDGARHFDLTATRRLTLAARAGRSEGILLHSRPAPGLSTASEARYEVSSLPGPGLASAGGRRPIPTHPAWGVRVLKMRAADGQHGRPDMERRREIIWGRAAPIPQTKGPSGDPLSLGADRRQKLA